MACKSSLSVRWMTAMMGCLGCVIIYGLRVNISVAIIVMVNHTAVNEYVDTVTDHEIDSNHSTDALNSNCLDDEQDDTSALEDGPFLWDANIQGIILAGYFYGYIFTQVIGGWLAEKYSAKYVFGGGILVNGVCTMVCPPAAYQSYIAIMFLRVMMGISAGMLLPAMHVLIAKWAPPQERSKISSTIYAGTTLGTLIFLPLSGVIASELGWEWVFYIQGALAIIYCIIWTLVIYESPDVHPMISEKERDFITTSLGKSVADSDEKDEKLPIPWKKVWTSKPLWAIIIAHTCNNWGWYMLLVKLPTYMKYILKFNIKSNALISAMPYLCMWIFTMLLANLIDYLRGRGTITTTFGRKMATFIASVPPGICLIAVTFVGCNTTLAVVLLTIGMTCLGGIFPGFLGNHIDIAPPFAGTMMGITNTFATVSGIVVPSFVGYMTNNNQTVEAWRSIFYITMGVYCFETAAYFILGSGEQQEWSKKKNTAKTERIPLDE